MAARIRALLADHAKEGEPAGPWPCPTCRGARIIQAPPGDGALREVIESLVLQFAYDAQGRLTTGGLSALEEAFDSLGWDDPHQLPKELLCDEPDCGERSTCGFPTDKGYRRTCGEHYRAALGTRKEGE
jgi:hypothetical protein